MPVRRRRKYLHVGLTAASMSPTPLTGTTQTRYTRSTGCNHHEIWDKIFGELIGVIEWAERLKSLQNFSNTVLPFSVSRNDTRYRSHSLSILEVTTPLTHAAMQEENWP
jgi:hypothetical protein